MDHQQTGHVDKLLIPTFRFTKTLLYTTFGFMETLPADGSTVPFRATNDKAREAREVLNTRPHAGLDENWR